MVSQRLSLHAVVVLFFIGCGADLDVPDSTQIACSSASSCPGDYRCIDAFQRCVPTNDGTAPTLLSADSTTEQNVVLVFSEAMDAPTASSLLDAYVFTPPLDVLSATPSDDAITVRLLTAPQIGGALYTAKANLYDLGGNPVDNRAGKTFTGCCSLADFAAPTILAPSDGKRVSGLSTAVAWTARRGAHSYTIRASTDPTFTAPEIVITVDATVTNIASFEVPTADSYYIEVVADVTLEQPARVRAAFFEWRHPCLLRSR